MEKPDTERFVLRTGVALGPDDAMIFAGGREQDEERISHTIVFSWNRESGWDGGLERFGCGSVCLALEPERQVIMLGEHGNFIGLGAKRSEGSVCNPSDTVTSVATVGDRPYVVGMNSLVLRRTSENVWERLDLRLSQAYDFEAIAGNDDQTYCAVGWNGAIVMVADGLARHVPSPTNVILTSVCLAGDGYYYACGQRGTLLRGRDDRWEHIAVDETQEDLWDVQWFQGRLLISSIMSVYLLTEDGKLELFDFGTIAVASAYHLHARDDSYLLSIGETDAALFDGTEWIALV